MLATRAEFFSLGTWKFDDNDDYDYDDDGDDDGMINPVTPSSQGFAFNDDICRRVIRYPDSRISLSLDAVDSFGKSQFRPHSPPSLWTFFTFLKISDRINVPQFCWKL